MANETPQGFKSAVYNKRNSDRLNAISPRLRRLKGAVLWPRTYKKFFIFDLDGTIINAYPAIVSSFNFTMLQMGLRPQKADVIKKHVGWGDINLLRPFVPKALLKKAVVIYRRHHAVSLLRKAQLMPYARRFLSFLAQKKVKMAVATNRPTRFSRLVLRHLRIEYFFDKVLCADRLKYAKPNPLVLNLLVKHAKVPKNEVIYIGDMVLDIQTAKRAGLDVLIVATGSSQIAEIKKEKPTYLVKDLKEAFRFCRKQLFLCGRQSL